MKRHGTDLELKFNLWLERFGERAIGGREAEILDALRRTGSITGAAKSLHTSYRYVWKHLADMEKAMGHPIIAAYIGGAGGGGAKLTVTGEDLLQEYRAAEKRLADAAKMAFPRPADLIIMGSHCIGVDVLLDMVRRKDPALTSRVTNVGSVNGLLALKRRETEIAGIHLYDPDTGQYNLPFLRKFKLQEKTVLISGYVRKQGLIVRRGNPKHIASIDDFTRSDVTIVNRNKGSGTRILVDMKLKGLAARSQIPFGQLITRIRGYGREMRSHVEVALAVLQRKADVGVGIQAAGSRLRLGFIPLWDENYDFALRLDAIQKPSTKTFLEVLKSGTFKQELTRRAPGLSATEKTGSVISSPPGFTDSVG